MARRPNYSNLPLVPYVDSNEEVFFGPVTAYERRRMERCNRIRKELNIKSPEYVTLYSSEDEVDEDDDSVDEIRVPKERHSIARINFTSKSFNSDHDEPSTSIISINSSLMSNSGELEEMSHSNIYSDISSTAFDFDESLKEKGDDDFSETVNQSLPDIVNTCDSVISSSFTSAKQSFISNCETEEEHYYVKDIYDDSHSAKIDFSHFGSTTISQNVCSGATPTQRTVDKSNNISYISYTNDSSGITPKQNAGNESCNISYISNTNDSSGAIPKQKACNISYFSNADDSSEATPRQKVGNKSKNISYTSNTNDSCGVIPKQTTDKSCNINYISNTNDSYTFQSIDSLLLDTSDIKDKDVSLYVHSNKSNQGLFPQDYTLASNCSLPSKNENNVFENTAVETESYDSEINNDIQIIKVDDCVDTEESKFDESIIIQSEKSDCNSIGLLEYSLDASVQSDTSNKTFEQFLHKVEIIKNLTMLEIEDSSEEDGNLSNQNLFSFCENAENLDESGTSGEYISLKNVKNIDDVINSTTTSYLDCDSSMYVNVSLTQHDVTYNKDETFHVADESVKNLETYTFDNDKSEILNSSFTSSINTSKQYNSVEEKNIIILREEDNDTNDNNAEETFVDETINNMFEHNQSTSVNTSLNSNEKTSNIGEKSNLNNKFENRVSDLENSDTNFHYSNVSYTPRWKRIQRNYYNDELDETDIEKKTCEENDDFEKLSNQELDNYKFETDNLDNVNVSPSSDRSSKEDNDLVDVNNANDFKNLSIQENENDLLENDNQSNNLDNKRIPAIYLNPHFEYISCDSISEEIDNVQYKIKNADSIYKKQFKNMLVTEMSSQFEVNKSVVTEDSSHCNEITNEDDSIIEAESNQEELLKPTKNLPLSCEEVQFDLNESDVSNDSFHSTEIMNIKEAESHKEQPLKHTNNFPITCEEIQFEINTSIKPNNYLIINETMSDEDDKSIQDASIQSVDCITNLYKSEEKSQFYKHKAITVDVPALLNNSTSSLGGNNLQPESEKEHFLCIHQAKQLEDEHYQHDKSNHCNYSFTLEDKNGHDVKLQNKDISLLSSDIMVGLVNNFELLTNKEKFSCIMHDHNDVLSENESESQIQRHNLVSNVSFTCEKEGKVEIFEDHEADSDMNSLSIATDMPNGNKSLNEFVSKMNNESVAKEVNLAGLQRNLVRLAQGSQQSGFVSALESPESSFENTFTNMDKESENQAIHFGGIYKACASKIIDDSLCNSPLYKKKCSGLSVSPVSLHVSSLESSTYASANENTNNISDETEIKTDDCITTELMESTNGNSQKCSNAGFIVINNSMTIATDTSNQNKTFNEFDSKMNDVSVLKEVNFDVVKQNLTQITQESSYENTFTNMDKESENQALHIGGIYKTCASKIIDDSLCNSPLYKKKCSGLSVSPVSLHVSTSESSTYASANENTNNISDETEIKTDDCITTELMESTSDNSQKCSNTGFTVINNSMTIETDMSNENKTLNESDSKMNDVSVVKEVNLGVLKRNLDRISQESKQSCFVSVLESPESSYESTFTNMDKESENQAIHFGGIYKACASKIIDDSLFNSPLYKKKCSGLSVSPVSLHVSVSESSTYASANENTNNISDETEIKTDDCINTEFIKSTNDNLQKCISSTGSPTSFVEPMDVSYGNFETRFKYRDVLTMDSTLITNVVFDEPSVLAVIEDSPTKNTQSCSKLVLNKTNENQLKMKTKSLLRPPKFNPPGMVAQIKLNKGAKQISRTPITKNAFNSKLNPPTSLIQETKIPKFPSTKKQQILTPRSETASSTNSQKKRDPLYLNVKSPIRAYIQNASPVLVTQVKSTQKEYSRINPNKKLMSSEKKKLGTSHIPTIHRPTNVVQKLKYGHDAVYDERENVDPNYSRPSLLPVTYKSAPNVFLKDNPDVQKKLPKLNEKFKKLLDTPKPKVIKHEGRANVPPSEPGSLLSTPRLTNATTVTVDSSNSLLSPYNNQGDISICATKTLFKTNSLAK